ncbi:MAG: hypothetical protein FWH14_08690 [Oscillospiraceae bacterium]|nr:hypothetical protein [Oscillospiraceae bacterium]
MANTRNKVAIVFDGVVCCKVPQRRVFFSVETPSQSALPSTALPKGEPRVSYTNSVGVLASPFGRGVMRQHDGEGGRDDHGHPWLLRIVGYAPPCIPCRR